MRAPAATEHEATGIGCLERHRRDLGRSKILDQQDVGILAQRGANRRHHRVAVAAHLALADERPPALVDKADLRLDRDDVIAARPVDQVDERTHQRRLAAGARPRDQDQTLGLAAEGLHFRREAELIRRDCPWRDHPEDQTRTTVLAEREASPADASDVLDVAHPLGRRAALPGVARGRRREIQHQTVDVRVGQRRARADVEHDDLAVGADHRLRLRHHVHRRGAASGCHAQQLRDREALDARRRRRDGRLGSDGLTRERDDDCSFALGFIFERIFVHGRRINQDCRFGVDDNRRRRSRIRCNHERRLTRRGVIRLRHAHCDWLVDCFSVDLFVLVRVDGDG